LGGSQINRPLLTSENGSAAKKEEDSWNFLEPARNGGKEEKIKCTGYRALIEKRENQFEKDSARAVDMAGEKAI